MRGWTSWIVVSWPSVNILTLRKFVFTTVVIFQCSDPCIVITSNCSPDGSLYACSEPDNLHITHHILHKAIIANVNYLIAVPGNKHEIVWLCVAAFIGQECQLAI